MTMMIENYPERQSPCTSAQFLYFTIMHKPRIRGRQLRVLRTLNDPNHNTAIEHPESTSPKYFR